MPNLSTAAPRIDAHHHLWSYSAAQYPWIGSEMSGLQRDFLIPDLAAALAAARVDSAIAVQARESLEETRWLLESAAGVDFAAGVVGWAPLESDDLPALLDEFAGTSKLVGFREIAQGQAAGFLDRPEFNRGIGTLTSLGLVYDLLIFERQLAEAIRLVDRHPLQSFVLDHAAKPRIAAGVIEPWATQMRELALRPNVVCKLSGMVTEADWSAWSLDTLRPYLDLCVEAFGPQRLLAGSDWPVCLVASSYERWWSTLEQYFARFTHSERELIFGGNATRVYGLFR